MKKIMQPLDNLGDLNEYDAVLLTGGEPMLHPNITRYFASALKLFNTARQVYLYTAMYSSALVPMLDIVDGITFTAHDTTSKRKLSILQNELQPSRYRHKSLRLSLARNIGTVNIKPHLWSSIKLKTWRSESNMAIEQSAGNIMQNEDVFLWNGILRP
jgi:organic radical activating enzyme